MNKKQLIVIMLCLLFNIVYAQEAQNAVNAESVIVADQKYWWESEGNLCARVVGKFNSREQMIKTLNLANEVGTFKSKNWQLHDILVSADFNANGDVATWIVSGPKPLLSDYVKELERQYKDKSLFYDFGYELIKCSPTAEAEVGDE